jgi:HD-like signal output (HDOD) protein
MDPLESLLSQVEALPTLPDVHLRIVEQIDDPRCNLRKIAEQIELDPVLTSRILGMANSALFGAGARTASVATAIQRLGTRDTRTLVMTAAVLDVFDAKRSRINLREFWTLGLASAICGRNLASEIGGVDPDHAYLAGLVHCMGEAMLGIYFPDRFYEAMVEARNQRVALVEAVWTEFGFTHPALCKEVLRRWNFPASVVEAVEYQLDPGEAPTAKLLASIVFASDRMCREMGLGTSEPGQPERNWLEEIPHDLLHQLQAKGYPSFHAYIERHRELLQGVAATVGAIFSRQH